MNQLTVTLPKFEGPLDLLLYLIRKEEMDIFDIKIHEITRQYLEYIKRMRELDLEVAGEFISMASTLIHIKSRMLLPQYNDQGEIIESEDPRKELVQRLLEYQKYQEAAKALSERPWVGRDIWLRGMRETIKPPEEEILLEDNALFSLIASYRKALKSFQRKIHRVAQKAQSISQRIMEIRDRLIPGQRVIFRELLTQAEDRTRHILITFLSLLELGKMGFVSLYQAETYGDIYIDTKKDIGSDIISRVEEFDGLKSSEAAAAAERLIKIAEAEAEAEALAQQEASASESALESELAEANGSTLTFELEDLVEDMASDDEILAAEAELEAVATEESSSVAWSFSNSADVVESEITSESASGATSIDITSSVSTFSKDSFNDEESLVSTIEVESKVLESQAPEAQGTESKSTEPKITESKVVESQTINSDTVSSLNSSVFHLPESDFSEGKA